MDFIGTGRRLAQGDVGDAARALGVETAVLLAFMEVEAAGRGFDNRNRPKMLRETHIFHRELGAGQQRDQAVAQGLATKSWVRNYSSDSYPDLQRMRQIDHNAALRSCSWGLSQIMGFNCTSAGHRNAEEMVRAAMQGEREQLMQMVTLMRAWGMVPMLTGKDFTKADSWRAAAQKWNGAGYATHNYHGRMAAAYSKHKGANMQLPSPSPTQPNQPVLRNGMKGEAVHNLQADLVALGYDVGPVDGRFGPKTDQAVRAFQLKSGLTADGVAGAKTWDALAKAIDAMVVDHTPPPEWAGQRGIAALIIAAVAGFIGWLFSRK